MFSKTDKNHRALEEYLYERVADEIERKEIKKGLWAMAISESQNDKTKAEPLYIKLRVQSLKDEAEELYEEEKAEIREKAVFQRAVIFKHLVKTAVIGFFILIIIMLLSN